MTNKQKVELMERITVTAFCYTVWGYEKGNENSTWENCITLGDCVTTASEILELHNLKYPNLVATDCRLDEMYEANFNASDIYTKSFGFKRVTDSRVETDFCNRWAREYYDL